MRTIAVIDAETDPFTKALDPNTGAQRVPKPFIWGYYNGSEYRQFDTTEELVAFIETRDEIIYAHNGGKFDFHFLLWALAAFDNLSIINGRIARVMLGCAELRDSFTILPVPLAAYKKTEIDYSIMEPGERDKPHNRKLIVAYLKDDCVYLWELVVQFVERFGLHITLPTAAMHQWKKISGLKPTQSDGEFYEDMSPYYYGGRVECFQTGIIDKDFDVYDINSAYPRAMLEKHPFSTNYHQADRYLKNADFVRVRCVSHGAFPYRGLGDPSNAAGLRFPNDGEPRDYFVTGWEYRTAKDTGTLTGDKVIESLCFAEHIDFASYVHHFYAMRMEAKAAGDIAGSMFAKLLMNGFYGKWASNPDTYRNYMIVHPSYASSLRGSGWDFGGELGPWVLAEAPLTEEQKRYYNVATGASITGYVRAMLWQALCASKDVLYCDTDSIAVGKRGALALGDELGQWKHEGTFDRAGIAGKKLYVFRGAPDWWDVDGKAVRAAKRPKDAMRLLKMASKGARLTQAQLWRVARGHEVLYVPEAPTFSIKHAPTFTARRLNKTAGVA